MQAEKFQSLLVSKNPAQFMIGTVPFSFAAPDAAKKVRHRFNSGLCFWVQEPEFDSKMRVEYMSKPIKRAVLFTSKESVVAVSTGSEMLSMWGVGMSLTTVVNRMRKMCWPSTQTLSGKAQTQLLNLTSKVQSLGSLKQVSVAGRAPRVVRNATRGPGKRPRGGAFVGRRTRTNPGRDRRCRSHHYRMFCLTRGGWREC